MTAEPGPDRIVMELTGSDVLPFLQGLITNDVRPLAGGRGLVWAALLTPQGKYLSDFFVGRLPDGRMILDLPGDQAEAVLRRLAMYRLRADVQMTRSGLSVGRGLDEPPADGFADPRHPAMGWRRYSASPVKAGRIDWDAIRVEHVIPESGIELVPDDSYILEAGFERLHGVDFRKGCYVGQEVTARMKHKTDLRKGLTRVIVAGETAPGAAITAEDREVGRLFTRSGNRALAHLRLDRAQGLLRAGAAEVRIDPDWPPPGAM